MQKERLNEKKWKFFFKKSIYEEQILLLENLLANHKIVHDNYLIYWNTADNQRESTLCK